MVLSSEGRGQTLQHSAEARIHSQGNYLEMLIICQSSNDPEGWPHSLQYTIPHQLNGYYVS